MPFVAAAITTALSAAGVGAYGAMLIGTTTAQLLTSVALSALSTAMATKPKSAGIRTSQTLTGGANPCSFVLGTYATSGVAVCPAMSHGKSGKTPNAYLTYVIELSDIAGMDLDSLILDGEAVTLGGTADPDYGYPVQGRFAGYAWVKYYDGSQTTADATLLSKYGSYSQRPWTSDMIGRGVCYAIMTFRYNREVFTSLPSVRFVVSGIQLYDPRADSTVGGSGSQRWANISTWVPSDNPMVQAYNILRGITLADGTIWGGDAQAGDLPLAEWFAAMNACDVAVSLAAGGTEPKYRAGFEVTLADEPAAILDELFKAASAKIVDMGGIWKPRVGPAAAPVYFVTDDDIIISRGQSYEPFQSLDQTHNGVSARYPEPNNLWETTEASPRYNSTYEAEDGGRRLVASLDLPAVPYGKQVQRLMKAWAKDGRRTRQHTITLPPSATALEPLDTISWDSTRNGYTTKIFDIGEQADSLMTMLQQVTIRETDSTDYSWSTGDEVTIGTAVGGVVVPAAQTLAGVVVTGVNETDDSGTARRPALRVEWTANDLDAVDAVKYQCRLTSSGAMIKRGTTHDVDDGELHIRGHLLPNHSYEVRIRPVVKGRATAWSSWYTATTPDTRIKKKDIGAKEVVASHIRTNTVNLYPDYDMLDDEFYSSSGSYSFVGTTISVLGQQYLNVPSTGSNVDVPSDWFQITPGVEYFVEARAWMLAGTAGAGTSTVFFDMGTVDAAGVVTATTTLTVKSATDTAYALGTSLGSIRVTPAADERRARFRVRSVAGGTSSARAGAFRMQRSADRNLVSDEAVSDRYRVTVATATVASGTTVIATLDLGAATVAGNAWLRGLSFEARSTGATYDIELHRRHKYAGTFGAWETQTSYTIAAGAAYDAYGSSATFAGDYEDYEYRIVTIAASAVSGTQIKNINLHATNLVK